MPKSRSDPLQDRLHALIGLIYEAALDPARWSHVMTALARAYDGSAVLFAEDSRAPDASVFGSGLLAQDRIRSYVEHYVTTNIWTPLIEPLPTGAIFDARIVPARAFERSEFYNGWLKPQDLYHSIGAVIANEDGLQTRLSVLRPRRAGLYRDDEMRAWEILAAHVQRAFRIHRELVIARLHRDAAGEGLDRLGVGAFLVDAGGRILSVNRAGTALLEKGDGLAAPAGRLTAARPRDTDRLLHLVREAARTAAGFGTHPGGATPLPRHDKAPLLALVCPMPGESFGPNLPIPAALILVSDPDHGAPTPESVLRQLYGLTAAEARLLAALVGGERLKDYADRNGVTMNTVRTQLAHIFAKTGHNRQAELVRACLSDVVIRMAAVRRDGNA